MTSPASDLAAELSSRQMARDAKMATDESYSDWATAVLRKHPKARISEERVSGGGYAKIATLDGRVVGKWKSSAATGYGTGGNGGGWVADSMATDPPVSEAQERAMHAAAAGKSTLGIPKKVGEEFVGKAKDAAGGGSAPEGSEGRYKIVGEPRTKSSRMERALSDLKKPPAKDASFPLDVRFGGKVYHSTGKRGKNAASGEESAEYESDTGERVWRTASGGVARDEAPKGRWGGRAP